MKVYESKDIRNVGVVGHGDSGKTTLTAGLLFTSGATNRLLRVDEGNTITDFDATADWIDLLEIDANGTTNGNQAFNPNGTSTHTPGDLWVTPYGAAGSSNYMLYGDVNGDGNPDFQIRIHLVGGSIDHLNIVY